MRPRGGGGPGRRRRRVVIDSQAARPRPDARQRPGDPPRTREPSGPPAPAPTGPVTIDSGATVKDVSAALGESLQKIMKFLMENGEMVNITQSLSDESIELIAAEFAPERELRIKHADDDELEPEVFEDDPDDLTERPPVVTIMGHVDHGKTSLLDALRESAVVETEAGGITQHIGAYQVDHSGRRITFLDTPGHEAFTALRARGAKVTDIAVLVVAADDGVMPQTIESINHARAAEVPFVVAVNKIDKDGANPTKVRQELVTEGLQPEEWGGDDAVRRRLREDEAGPRRPARADPARRRRRARAAGEREGRRLRADHREPARRRPWADRDHARPARHDPRRRRGRRRATRGARSRRCTTTAASGSRRRAPARRSRSSASTSRRPPVSRARVVENDRQARHLAQLRGQRVRAEQLARRGKGGISLEDLFTQIESGAVQELNIVVKADVQGSIEAVTGELGKIRHPEVGVNVIHTGIGAISESDVILASASNAIVVGFNVRPNADARALAEREGVDIRTYRVIYQLTEDIQQALVGMLSPEQVEETLGEAEVRAVFRASRVGTIAGCYVTEGNVRRNAQVRIVREGTVIYETTIASLKRFKDDVREVQAGFECGILLENFNDVKEGDVLEFYETREIERTDLSSAGNGGPPADDAEQADDSE